MIVDVLEKSCDYDDRITSQHTKRERLCLMTGFQDGYEEWLKDFGISETIDLSEKGEHTVITELVSEIKLKVKANEDISSLLNQLDNFDLSNVKKK